jgi:PAS domain S-box-containing protein
MHKPSIQGRFRVPLAVLALCLATTLTMAAVPYYLDLREDRSAFDHEVALVQDQIANRLSVHLTVLRGAAGLAGAGGLPAPPLLQSYVRAVDVAGRYPGLQGIGLVVAQGSTARVVALAPSDAANDAMLGLDLASSPAAMEAMARARDTGEAALSARVDVASNEGGLSEPGVLAFMPVYRAGGYSGDVAERRADLLGFVFSPLRANDLLEGVVGRHPVLGLSVYDGVGSAPELLATLGPEHPVRSPQFVTDVRLDLGGRPWTIRCASHPWPISLVHRYLPTLVFAAGMVISLVIFLLSLGQAQARHRAERAARALRQSEEARQTTESMLHRVVETNLLGVVIADRSGAILEANDAFLSMLGYERAELEHGVLDWRRLAPDWDLASETQEPYRRPYEKRYRHKGGRAVPVLLSAAMIDEQRAVGLVLDLSEHKKAEERAHRSAEQLRLITDTVPALISYIDTSGCYRFTNRAYDAWLGREPYGLDGVLVRDAWGESAYASLAPHLSAAQAGSEVTFELALPDGAGTRRHLRGTYLPHLAADGSVLGVVGLLVDVSESKRAEQERALLLADAEHAREQAEAANRVKDEFMAVLSHELRTPLTPVFLVLQMLRDQPEAASFKPVLDIARRNVEVETRLIDDLLDLNRVAHGKLQVNLAPLDAHAIVARTLDICASGVTGKGIELATDLAAEESWIEADAARLQQILWNLVQNAMKFTPAGKRITVRSRNLERRLCLEVLDEGMGIDAALLPKLFEPFEQGNPQVTRRFGGLGLGLAISRELVLLQHGEIAAESLGPGRGSTFRVEFPLLATARVAPQHGEAGEVGKADAGPALRVLLVEDHEDTLTVVRLMLEKRGHEVLGATNGEEAMRIAGARDFDLLISDIGLPDTSGLTLLEHLRRRHPVKAIAMSGFGSELDIKRSREAGFAEHLTKPVSFVDLERAIGHLFEKRARLQA